MSDVRKTLFDAAAGHGVLGASEAAEVQELVQSLDTAGRELATALWALVLAQEPSMSLSRDRVIQHASSVVRKYTTEGSREQLAAALERARDLGGEWTP